MKAAKITSVIVVLVLVVSAVGCVGGQADYQTGYDAGYDTGYDVGYDLGYDAGYDVGYAQGCDDCQVENATEEAQPPVTEPQTFERITITGAGDKTSAPFEVTTDEWIIEWSYTADDPEWAAFYFFVYPRGETVMYVESVTAGEGETHGSTYSYAGPGEYYVAVLAANIEHWQITVKPA
ncbi:MAG: hypothetical protein E3J66_03940 [Dehalococcoidia bacterium]|nr:MAG: hypothetical protein E3J66_03940 [Dehalococcoidia bacterium]